jgi:cation:H+ antiporter
MILFAWIGSIFWTQHLYTSRSIKKQRRVETAVVTATSTALLHKIAPRKTAPKKQSIQSAIFITVFGAIIILIAGYGLEASGEILSKKWGMSGILFGSTILAFCTALPEISTGIASAKIRDYQMAVSDIFGGNAFLPTLFLMAAIIGGDTILPNLKSSDIYLTIVGMVLTSVYLVGMLFHSKKQYFRMGIDSIIVLILYIASIWGLVYLQ